MGRVPFLGGKVAVIAGASSGIGRATALELARCGARVVLAARRNSVLQEVAANIHALGGEALPVPTDVSHRGEVEDLVQAALARWGRVDVLVYSAGLYVRSPVAEMTLEEMERSLAVNFYGGLYAVQAVLPHLLERKSGHIVLVTSMDAKKGLPPDAPYVTAKFALTGFGEVLRQELRGSGVNVTTVLPGRVDTPMIEDLAVPWISAKIPPEAVAGAIARALRRPRPEIIIPWQTKILVYFNTLSPRLGDWAVRHFRLSGWEDKEHA